MKKISTLTLAALTACLMAEAEPRLPHIFCDGMVLQQRCITNIWGWDEPGTEVTVTAGWNSATYKTTAAKDGSWSVKVGTPVAGGPYTMTVGGTGTILLSDIMIGEVWICSGQSNMEMPMAGFPGQPVDGSQEDIAASANPNLRLFHNPRAWSIEVMDDTDGGKWETASPESVAQFSATAYYFGRKIQESTQVPVGLIMTCWSGSCIECWMREDWLSEFDGVEIPRQAPLTRQVSATPTVLYNAMIAPLAGYGIRGAIWYQGESNVGNWQVYSRMMHRMISNWRADWGMGDFPFYYCQIAPWEYGPDQNSALLREQQLNAQYEIPNTAMACLLDCGQESVIHPSQKIKAGERLALLALARDYRMSEITSQAPEYRSMDVRGKSAVLTFSKSAEGLRLTNDDLSTFEVAGKDGVFHPATKVTASGNKVTVSSSQVDSPAAVRYCFRNWCVGNLKCGDLPVSSFRTDSH